MGDWRNDWHDWLKWYPPSVLLRVWKPGWDKPQTMWPWDLEDVKGAVWTLTGCGKQQIVRAGD